MDMNKEKEAFEAWWDERGDLKNNGPWEKDTPIQFAWEAWQAAKAESHKSASLYQWEINHLAAANQQWRDYAAKANAVPKGFVVVPKEPTEKMIDAGHTFCKTNIVTPTGFYKAMIEAAQEPGHDR